jgi:uncharacterized protein (DUF1800 family)
MGVLSQKFRCGWAAALVTLLAGCAAAPEAELAAKQDTAALAAVAGPPRTMAAPSSPAEASRFLAQATFGPTEAEIAALAASDYETWLETQFALPRQSHLAYVFELQAQGEDIDNFTNVYAIESFWHQAVTGQDQLRQRMTWALSQIFVVGELDNVRNASYYDTLAQHAFGNYRDLLEAVTLHPAMGHWLSHIANRKEDLATGRLPDENYAREVMQLFSIGLWELNPDGTRRLDAQGQPIPTYGQDEIRGMAKVLTGWSYVGCDPVLEEWYCFDGVRQGWYRNYTEVTSPMVAYADYHSTSPKVLVGGVVLAGGGSAQQDLDAALDVLFHHPNTGPFISRQLIQRFVRSNPSPAYVARVAAVFADNGQGVRGDLRAVLAAILLDSEARDPAQAADPNAGKLREPVIRFTHYLRAFTQPPANGRYDYNPWWMQEVFAQRPLSSPSVFNFYRPDYVPSGPAAQAGLAAPEFQILHEATLASGQNFLDYWIYVNPGEPNLHRHDYGPLLALAGDPAALVDRLDLILTAGSLSPASRAAIVQAVSEVGAGDPEYRVVVALALFHFSPDFLIQK